jgi:adenylate cyclase
MNYTAIGDAINFDSRLEGLNKRYGSSIIASDTIVNRANETFDFRRCIGATPRFNFRRCWADWLSRGCRRRR